MPFHPLFSIKQILTAGGGGGDPDEINLRIMISFFLVNLRYEEDAC